jgi:hypothetical protein
MEEAFGNLDKNGPPDNPSAYILFYTRDCTQSSVEEKIKNISDI